MATTTLEPLAALALLLLAAACAPSDQVGYSTADRAAMDTLHAAVLDEPRVTASDAPGAPFRHVVYDR